MVEGSAEVGAEFLAPRIGNVRDNPSVHGPKVKQCLNTRGEKAGIQAP
jgi:hypothetical protein